MVGRHALRLLGVLAALTVGACGPHQGGSAAAPTLTPEARRAVEDGTLQAVLGFLDRVPAS